MRACAKKGGVIGLSGVGPFLGSKGSLLDRLLRQLRYAIDQVGAEHVGLGLDYVFDRAELEEHVRRNPRNFEGTGLSGTIEMVEPEAIGAIAEDLASKLATS